MAEPTASRAGLGGIRHLTRRLVWSLRPRHQAPGAETALLARLSEGEADLYHRMAPVDRAHAVHNAEYCVEVGLGDELIVAAALHDVGKTQADLGTPGRVVASIVTVVGGRDRVASWHRRDGIIGRIGTYAAHPELGAAMLAAADSAPEVVAWAQSHHRPLGESKLPPSVATVLWQADQL